MIKISDKQVEAVLMLQPFDRYQHSIKLIADTGKLYSLLDKDERWELAEVEGRITFFIWPHEAYAKTFLVGQWQDSRIEEITIGEYEEEIKKLFISE
jgi:hypothetical protein